MFVSLNWAQLRRVPGHAFVRDQTNPQVEDVVVSSFTSGRKIPIVEMNFISLPFLE
jgi:hypothetical protein